MRRRQRFGSENPMGGGDIFSGSAQPTEQEANQAHPGKLISFTQQVF
jgi:hypothetical protein